jgi:hypothetical protein
MTGIHQKSSMHVFGFCLKVFNVFDHQQIVYPTFAVGYFKADTHGGFTVYIPGFQLGTMIYSIQGL